MDFQNIADFKKMQGQPLPPGEWLTVTQDMINSFADATLDFQWIHIDVEKAKKHSPFKAPVAHGFMSLSLLSKMVAGVSRIKSAKMGINYGVNKVRFPNPVRVNSRLRLTATIAKAEDYGDNGVKATWDCIIELEEKKNRPVLPNGSLLHLNSG